MRTTVVVETIQPISEVKARSLSDDVLCRDKKQNKTVKSMSQFTCMPAIGLEHFVLECSDI